MAEKFDYNKAVRYVGFVDALKDIVNELIRIQEQMCGVNLRNAEWWVSHFDEARPVAEDLRELIQSELFESLYPAFPKGMTGKTMTQTDIEEADIEQAIDSFLTQNK